MQKFTIKKDSTSRILLIDIYDSASTIGARLAGLVFNTASLTAFYNREAAAGAATAITLVTATKGTYSSGGFIAIDATNMPGHYELHIPDAALATGASSVLIRLGGAANMVPKTVIVRLVDNVEQTGDAFVRLGAPAGASTSADIAAAKVDTAAIKLKTDNLPEGITKNAILNNFMFFMVDSTDGRTGKTLLTVTATRSIDGAAFGACANAVTEVANGTYKISLAAADLNGDIITLKFTATGADARIITIKTEA